MSAAKRPERIASAAAARGAGFLALWIVLIGIKPLDVGVGVFAAAAATWVSLALLPPAPRRLRWLPTLQLLAYFLWKSLVAGVDVARRALAPRVRVNPGYVRYPLGLSRPPVRNAFAMFTGLMPGTVPCEEENGSIVYHCLDVDQPVAAELAEAERQLARTLETRDA